MTKIIYLCIFILTLSTDLADRETEAVISLENELESKIQYNMYVEFVNQYFWRNIQLHPEANIQSAMALSYKDLSLRLYISKALASPLTETYLFLSYTLPVFTLIISACYAVNSSYLKSKEFFNYSNKTVNPTKHSLEFSIVINSLTELPLNFTAATNFYGNERDEAGNNLYSSYLETAYTQKCGDYGLPCFIGGTIRKSYYAEKASIENKPFSLKKKVNLNQSSEIIFKFRNSLQSIQKRIVLPIWDQKIKTRKNFELFI